MADPDRVVALLGELVGMESPSGDDDRLAALAGRFAELLRAAGVSTDVRPGGHLVGRLEGGDGPPVLVLGHLDTVWPVGRLAAAPFTVADGRATGPGVFDMKGGLVALLLALEELRDAGGPAQPVRIVLTADEEIGSPVGGGIVAEQVDGVAAVLALEPPLPGGTLKVGRRGVARVRLSVTGREAHAGLDRAGGVSAIEELVDQLLAVGQALPPGDEQSVNIGTIGGGTRANVVAGSAEAELGLRFASSEAERRVFGVLEGLSARRPGATVTSDVLSHRPAWEPTGSAPLADHVRSVAAAMGEVVDAAVSPGAGDANLTGGRGWPTVDGLGPRGSGAHAPDETVELASIPTRARLLARVLAHPLPAHAVRDRTASAAHGSP